MKRQNSVRIVQLTLKRIGSPSARSPSDRSTALQRVNPATQATPQPLSQRSKVPRGEVPLLSRKNSRLGIEPKFRSRTGVDKSGVLSGARAGGGRRIRNHFVGVEKSRAKSHGTAVSRSTLQFRSLYPVFRGASLAPRPPKFLVLFGPRAPLVPLLSS